MPARPSFATSPPALVARFESLAARVAEAERRQMFGYPALFLHGNLVTGLFGDRWMIRLPPDDAAELMTMAGAGPFEPMPGRPMKGYATLPDEIVADDARLESWVRRALDRAASLPPK
jgi:TfoX/Sxy family transcriptional regulator of competence genes